jgi:hypothetical protein
MKDRITYADIKENQLCIIGLKAHAKTIGYSWRQLIREGYPIEEAEEAVRRTGDPMIAKVIEYVKNKPE